MQSKRHKRTDIQALRTIAVLAVVIYHLWPNKLTGGFMGVDIFFVISGYLMTLTIMKDVPSVISANDKVKASLTFLGNFYARRIKRLIPAAAVTLVATTVLVLATNNLDLISKTTEQVAASALFVQNWQLAKESTDYLAPSEPPTAVQHFWSLSVEEQFYLIWPLLLLTTSFLLVQVFIVYKNKKIAGTIIPLSVLATSFFIYGYLATKNSPAEAYFITPARVWELIIGGVIAFLPVLKNYDLKLMLPWLGLTMNTYALTQLDGSNFPGWHALIPVVGTALILYGGTSISASPFSFTHLFKSRPIQWIGDISYSLYLWHWPLIVLLPILFAIDIEGPNELIIKTGLLALSFIIAWLSYRYIEKPPQRINVRNRWIYASFVVIVGGIAGGATFTSQLSSSKAADGLRNLHEIATGNDPCFGARGIANERHCGNPFDKQNSDWKQYIKSDASLNIISDNGRACSFYRLEDGGNPENYCTYGDSSAKKTIVMYGDSHADHWVNALDDIGKRNNIKFIHLSSGSCAADIVTSPECDERRDFNRKFLSDADAVIVSFLTKDNPSRASIALNAVKSDTRAPIYFMEDAPYAGVGGGLECSIKNACVQPRENALQLVNKINLQLIESGILKEDHIIKTADFFCNKDECFSYIGGVSVYRDSDNFGNSHISSVYSLSLSRLLEAELKRKQIF